MGALSLLITGYRTIFYVVNIHQFLTAVYNWCMGILEETNAKRVRRHNIQKVILQTVTAAGVLSVAIVAPNALQALRQFGYKPHKRHKEVIARSRARLVEHGLLSYNPQGLLRVTPKGEAKLRQLEAHDYRLKKPRKWDGKWRILSFDIKEKRRGMRDKLRFTLRAIGFEKLHQSAWVYPYPCEDLINLLKADFKIGKDVLYIIADSIENDRALRAHFGLPTASKE